MIKIFVGALVVAEVIMLASNPAIKSKVGDPLSLIPQPPPVDAKWARAMTRKVEAEIREASRQTGRRQAIEACLGPDRESFTPTRYEARAKACEGRLAKAERDAAEAAAAPAASAFEYPKPPPPPPPPTPAPEPAAPVAVAEAEPATN